MAAILRTGYAIRCDENDTLWHITEWNLLLQIRDAKWSRLCLKNAQMMSTFRGWIDMEEKPGVAKLTNTTSFRAMCQLTIV